MSKLILGLFAFFWILLVGGVDAIVAFNVWKALRTTSWITTTGTVTESRLERRKKSVSLVLRYTYTVNGQAHRGSRYDFGPAFLPDLKWPAIQAELTTGTKIVVYYDPNEPTETVLHPGVEPDILPIAISLMPFNVVGVVLGLMFWRTVTGYRNFDPQRDVRTLHEATVVRLNSFGRLAVFGMTLLGSSFGCVFLVVVLMHAILKVPTSWLLDGAILGAIVLGSGLAAQRFGYSRFLAHVEQRLNVPNTSTGPATIDLPQESVSQVRVIPETRRGSKGRTSTVYVVSLVAQPNGVRQNIPFAEYTDSADAEALATWLRDHLGVKPDNLFGV